MHYLDLSGLNCPMPVLKAKKYLSELISGDTVTITTTDPDSVRDLQVFCEKTKNIFMSQQVNDDSKIITIIKKR